MVRGARDGILVIVELGEPQVKKHMKRDNQIRTGNK
jgi:hypothetical protein